MTQKLTPTQELESITSSEDIKLSKKEWLQLKGQAVAELRQSMIAVEQFTLLLNKSIEMIKTFD